MKNPTFLGPTEAADNRHACMEVVLYTNNMYVWGRRRKWATEGVNGLLQMYSGGGI